MLFFTPTAAVLFLHIFAAVLPAIFLMRYIYKHDRAEREPGYLLISLVGMGVLAALAAIVLETAASWLLNLFSRFFTSYTAYVVFFAFAVVAAVEEGTKLYFLKRRSWYDPNFNWRFDGIVYSVFVSLGFAAFENIKYVMNYGLSVALPRAFLAVPGHMSFAVFMGIFYGRAKLCARNGNRNGCRLNLALGYLSAVFFHGFYDSCAMLGTKRASTVFLIFVALMFLSVFFLVRSESEKDRML